MTKIPQRDTGRLMRYRCRGCGHRRPAAEQRTRLGQRLYWPGMREYEEVIRPGCIWGAIAIL
jgi:hypothetical protein